MNYTDLCEYLEWDSQFFKQRIARVIPDRLSSAAIQEIDSWCTQNRIDCLYFLADPDDHNTTQLARQNAYELVDIRLLFDCPVTPSADIPETAPYIRPGAVFDIPTLRDIARQSYRTYTRFYTDPHFSKAQCDELYATWIDKSVRGYADTVLIAERDNVCVGFISCHLKAPCGEIGLVGVDSQARGEGVGRQLVYAALNWFAAQKVETVSVVTQARNIGAQRLYQACGFRTRTLRLWYHRWAPFGEAPPGH